MNLDDALAVIYIYDTELIPHLEHETRHAVAKRIEHYTAMEMRKREVERKNNATRTRNQRKKMEQMQETIDELNKTIAELKVGPREASRMLNAMRDTIRTQERRIMELEIKCGLVKVEMDES